MDDNELDHKLIWNAYEEWPNGVEEYILYAGADRSELKEIDRISPSEMLRYKNSKDRFYIEQKSSFNYEDLEQFCYAIEAVENPPYFRKSYPGRSYSNVSCFLNINRLFVPNSFTPNDDLLNEEFKVHGSVNGLVHFKMLIFNRWGDLIYESEDPFVGWNGKLGDRNSPIGVYLYKIEYSTKNDPTTLETLNGSFSLLR